MPGSILHYISLDKQVYIFPQLISLAEHDLKIHLFSKIFFQDILATEYFKITPSESGENSMHLKSFL